MIRTLTVRTAALALLAALTLLWPYAHNGASADPGATRRGPEARVAKAHAKRCAGSKAKRRRQCRPRKAKAGSRKPPQIFPSPVQAPESIRPLATGTQGAADIPPAPPKVPAGKTPDEEAPVEETPVKQPPVEEPPIEQPPAEGAPVEEPGVEEPEVPPASALVSPPQLKWAPPTLVNPKTITLGTGYTHTSLSPTHDYIIKLPATKKIGGTWIDGGHNVVVIGGSVTVPTGTDPGVAYDAQRNGIYIKDATGTVHVEGVLIDGSGGAEFDGIDINAPQATIQLENLRIVGVRGGFGSFHADVVQPWGGVKDLRIDRLTGRSNYQGLMLQPDLGPIGSAEISNVDLTATAESPVDRGGHMLWLTRGSTSCAGYPVTLSNVFVTPRPGSTVIQSVWPTISGLSCSATGSSSVAWPKLDVDGVVQEASALTGEFAPPQSAGLNYVSPGYATAN